MLIPPPSDLTIHSSLANDEMMAELVEVFVSEIPTRLQTLQSAFAANNIELLHRTAHQLKGAFGSYGFDQLTEPATRLEMSVQTCSGDLQKVQRDLDYLASMCKRLSSAPEKASTESQG
jgi:histidine phosphotransfer protein HptB